MHYEDASLSLFYSVSSSLSSKCMPIRCARRISQFQEYSRRGTLFKYTDEDIKIIVASNYITEAARRPAVSYNTVMTIIVFLYMLLQLFAMHKPRLQAPSDYISDVFDSLDPWPQQYSCSFRFKCLERAFLGSLDPFWHSPQHPGFFQRSLGSDAHETAFRHFDLFRAPE